MWLFWEISMKKYKKKQHYSHKMEHTNKELTKQKNLKKS